MKKLILFFVIPFFSAKIFAQSFSPIQDQLQSPELSLTLTQPFLWSNQEDSAFQTIFNSPRFSAANNYSSFDITNTSQLRLLKDLLDLIPSDRNIANRRHVGYFSNNCCNNNFDPCLFEGPPTNYLKTENKLAIDYLIGSTIPLNWPDILFDIKTLDICKNKTKSILIVNSDGKFGFNTNQPVANYHFAIPDIQIGNSNTLMFKIDTVSKTMRFSNGNNELLKVDGNGVLYARRIKVTATNPFPDYVFDKDYKLMSLDDLEQFISKNKHLPNINSAEDYQKSDGVDVSELQLKLLEKVEELTLYILQQERRIEQLEKELCR